jgi:hypothetical protein
MTKIEKNVLRIECKIISNQPKIFPEVIQIVTLVITGVGLNRDEAKK